MLLARLAILPLPSRSVSGSLSLYRLAYSSSLKHGPMASTPTLRQRQTATAERKPALERHAHAHSHSHGHDNEEADALMAALKGGSDPGSRVTLIGLGSNVGLTIVKGTAGWALGSAALLADAAHSGSDLLADIVTLTTYRMSRKPVSLTHPYGYGSTFPPPSIGSR